MTEEQLRQGKIAWELQKKEYGYQMCNQIENAVNTFGAEGYWAIMQASNKMKNNIPKKARDLVYLSLKYVEHKQQENANKN